LPQAASAPALNTGGPPPETLALAPDRGISALATLPVAPGSEVDSAAVDLVVRDATAGAAAPGIMRKEARAGLPSVAGRTISNAPEPGELRLARPSASPRLELPPVEIPQAVARTVVAAAPAPRQSAAIAAPTFQRAVTNEVRRVEKPADLTEPAGSEASKKDEMASQGTQRRLDDVEMARVVDTVLTTLKQRLRHERESRGL
jgi:hypothetical protein